MSFGGSMFGFLGLLSRRQLGIHLLVIVSCIAVNFMFFAVPVPDIPITLSLPPSEYFYGEYYGTLAKSYILSTCKTKTTTPQPLQPEQQQPTADMGTTFRAYLRNFLVAFLIRQIPIFKILDMVTGATIVACKKTVGWLTWFQRRIQVIEEVEDEGFLKMKNWKNNIKRN